MPLSAGCCCCCRCYVCVCARALIAPGRPGCRVLVGLPRVPQPLAGRRGCVRIGIGWTWLYRVIVARHCSHTKAPLFFYNSKFEGASPDQGCGDLSGSLLSIPVGPAGKRPLVSIPRSKPSRPTWLAYLSDVLTCDGRHSPLCPARQCFRWQLLLQYLTSLHTLHLLLRVRVAAMR